jgi:hypothetical protein
MLLFLRLGRVDDLGGSNLAPAVLAWRQFGD